MFSTLLKTEFQANARALVLAVIANIILFMILATAEEPRLDNFMAATMLVFYLMLIVLAIIIGDEKRSRLYAQLPVTSSQAFLVGWIFVLFWLMAQVLVWILFGLVWDANFTMGRVADCLAVGLGMAILITVVSIGIDLINFRPRYVLWAYVGCIALAFALTIHAEVTISIISSADSEEILRLVPFALFENTRGSNPLGWIVAILLLLSLLGIDYKVYRNADHYLS